MKITLPKKYLLALIAMPFWCSSHQKGVVIVPVADLIGDPISHLFPGHSPEYAYNHLPWSCYQAHYGANGRLHQLLFHEQVTIICSTKHEVCIEVPQVFYTTRTISSPQIRYWTLKKNIMPLSDRIAGQIPPQIHFRNKKSIYTPHIAHLLEPWHAKEFGITFSAGTRFVVKSIGTDIVSLCAINPRRYTMTTLSIPKKIIHIQKNSHTQRIADFISVCQRWAHTLKGDIAYTLGGCSYVQTHKKSAPFTRAKSIITPQALLQYERPEDPAIKTGLDCSNLILRAAQIAGIPYFYKNTHTIERHIRPLASHEQIESGDIIWMPGHVLIVSDAYKGLCIEAHSYDGGYGIVHELPLEKVFKGITSCTALAHALRNKKQLYRLHKNGNVQQVHTNAKVLKLKSLFT